MLSNKFLFQILQLGIFVIYVAATFSPAQKISADQMALTRFEKAIEQGNYADIERDLLNYAIQNPLDARAFELLGRLRSAQNRFSEAKSLYQKSLSLNAHLISARINLAIIDFQTGNSEQATDELNKITDADVSNDSLRLKLAQTFELFGNCLMALNYIEKLDAKIKNSDALPISAACYLQSGEKQKVNSLILTAKNISKQNPTAAIKFAVILSDAAMYKESADILRVIISFAPQNVEALILLAKLEIYTKNFVNAKIHLNQAAKINPNAPDLFFIEGLLEGEQGNAVQALGYMEKSLVNNPDSATVLRQYVIEAMRANQAGKAVKAAEKLLELKPNEPESLYLYGAASLQNNNLLAAENWLNHFAELRPQDALGCLALGLTYAAQAGKMETARKQLLHCVDINPNNFEAKYQLGLSYKTQGETAKAIEYLEATVKDAPEFAAALRDLGAVYLQAGAENKAKIVLEKSIALNPNDPDTHFQLSRLYNLTGETELAKKHLEIFQKLKNSVKNGM